MSYTQGELDAIEASTKETGYIASRAGESLPEEDVPSILEIHCSGSWCEALIRGKAVFRGDEAECSEFALAVLGVKTLYAQDVDGEAMMTPIIAARALLLGAQL